MLMASAMLLLLSGCEDGADFNWEDNYKRVLVTVNLTLTNGYSKDAYLVLQNLNETHSPSTLVKPNASRIVKYQEHVINDPKFESAFEMNVRGEADKGGIFHTLYVDFKKYNVSYDDVGKRVGVLTVNVNAVFTGTSWTVTITPVG
ncbi:MAG: hypothetical protein PHT35_08100 [Bacteroidales bacterium]|nr:hypothetical protein [Bacteroidales bacterium]MDD4435840.1 hypothetical protein [Bacteroidales bacterium]HOZ19650.1 hypothetical protein [Bacteroidales bacterium]